MAWDQGGVPPMSKRIASLALVLAAALAATGATVFMATGNVDPTVQDGPPASEVIALRFAEDFAPTRGEIQVLSYECADTTLTTFAADSLP